MVISGIFRKTETGDIPSDAQFGKSHKHVIIPQNERAPLSLSLCRKDYLIFLIYQN